MQALWIFVIQNDLYTLETKSINTSRTKFGKGRFKTLHVGISHEMHQDKIKSKGPDRKAEEENRGPRT